jgi:hypothetical protein
LCSNASVIGVNRAILQRAQLSNDEFWRDSGAILARFWRDSGAILARFWRDSGAILARLMTPDSPKVPL